MKISNSRLEHLIAQVLFNNYDHDEWNQASKVMDLLKQYINEVADNPK